MSSALQHLAALNLEAKRIQHPTVPAHALPKVAYSDKTANGLTACVVDYINLSGGYAVRINTQGQYDERRKIWRHGATRKGTADIHAVYAGRHLSIEIKIGRDVLSEEQRATAEDVERAGGRYFVCRDYESFYAWFTAQFLTPPFA